MNRFVFPIVLAAAVAASPLLPTRAAAQAASRVGHASLPSRAPAESTLLRGLAERVEIRRTAYGVPHIQGSDLEAAAFGLAYVQVEDYGARVVRGLLEARGELARIFGPDSLDGAFTARQAHARAQETFHRLGPDTRAAYRGFAEGVNHYVALHPEEFPFPLPRFSGHDVLARDIVGVRSNRVRSFLEELDRKGIDGVLVRHGGGGSASQTPSGVGSAPSKKRIPRGAGLPWPGPASTSREERRDASGAGLSSVGIGSDPWAVAPDIASESWAVAPDVGSNAWALGPERTTSGHAILLRNPHLSWDAGYYEAHLTVPGVLDFYGDFRVGGPFGIIGGFNERLGWATTNNAPDLEEIYALRLDPDRPDHVLFDDGSLPLRREDVTVEVASGDGLYTETRSIWRAPVGPVIERRDGFAFVIKAAADGEFRLGEQFLAMMKARSLDEWKAAMRIHARVSSNFTYADADGNIFYVWNATTPRIPHVPGGDTLAFEAWGTDDVWEALVPWDELPQLANPPGGYLHNENDPFHFTNLLAPLDSAAYPANFPAPRLRLRSQHALALVGGRDRLSLEEVVARKHSMRMLLADRVKNDLLVAVRAVAAERGQTPEGGATPEQGARSEADASAGDRREGRPDPGRRAPDANELLLRAGDLLETWDNTVARDSRGGVLFREWFRAYEDRLDGDSLFAQPWTAERPIDTPRGLARPDVAAQAFAEAVEHTRERFGAWDVAWGDVHRVRMGDVDLPVGGCAGALGCFRVLSFQDDDDGKRRAVGGDGWILAVEFGPTPRAYSVLAYGQSDRRGSPHHADQAALFADNRMKPVAFTETDVQAATIRRYRPGEEVGTRSEEVR